MVEDEKRIKFPDRHYIGFRQDPNVLTAFMTPEGTDSGAKKRKESVDRWVENGSRRYDHQLKQYVVKDTPPTATVDNKPLEGFGIEQRLNRGGSWYGNQDKWKIEDPRGFQLEISGSNLQKIIESTTIINGVIQGECVWARLGSDNILVPVGTDVYQNAANNTARAKKSANLKDLAIGDYVIMQNGKEGQFLGQYYLIHLSWDEIKARKFNCTSNKQYVFIHEDEFFAVAKPKISEIRDNMPALTEEEINKRLIGDKTVAAHQIAAKAVSSLPVKSPELMWSTTYDLEGYGYAFNEHSSGNLAGAYVSSYNREVSKDLCLYNRDLDMLIGERRQYGVRNTFTGFQLIAKLWLHTLSQRTILRLGTVELW